MPRLTCSAALCCEGANNRPVSPPLQHLCHDDALNVPGSLRKALNGKKKSARHVTQTRQYP
ncbi:hypothetical protein CBM2605_A260001 [Cupriavidus neocaledonicus]|uniref:Transposase n=1 Tax=Cupriavidus neocaledonicus TaxID=1040979 RepID=A0ABY1V1J3_9BURK|nr:hypothetical protein CBM2605_A260001 [Cupriavidus neocaledonicus]